MRHTQSIMIKHLLLTLLAIVASTAVITAQDQPEQTAAPEITVIEDDDLNHVSFQFTAEEGAEIFFSINGEYMGSVPLDGGGYVYTLELFDYDDETVTVEAYAQCSGKTPSEWVSYDYNVPERTCDPIIEWYIDYDYECAVVIIRHEEYAEVYYDILDTMDGCVLYQGVFGDPEYSFLIYTNGIYLIRAYAESPGLRRSRMIQLYVTVDESMFTPPPFDKDGIIYERSGHSSFVEVAGMTSEYSSTYSGDLIIPETVEYDGKVYTVDAIRADAFAGYTSLKSISLPNTITRIEFEAFCETGLESIFIPASVDYIASTAFSGCNDLLSIRVDENNPTYDSRDNCNAIIETATNTLVCGFLSTDIPLTVTALGDHSFGGYTSGLHLTDIVIPDNILSIGDAAFLNCELLEDVRIGSSVTTIGHNAFRKTALKHVVLPASVEALGYYVFYYNRHLVDITCKSITPPTASDLLSTGDDYSNYETVKLYVPNESIEAYRAHEEWGRFTHIVPFIGAGPGDVDGDGNIAIKDVTGLIDTLLSGGELPAYCDVDGDGTVTIKDVTALIDMLLGGN